MSSRSEKSYAATQWENEGGAMRPPTIETEIGRKLAAHGITAIPLTVYEWSGYRYTNAKDAIAAAERNIR
jgi:uroporphyrinogen-III synthase